MKKQLYSGPGIKGLTVALDFSRQNQKELTKTFRMILIEKTPFGCDVFYKLIQRFNVNYSAALQVISSLFSYTTERVH